MRSGFAPWPGTNYDTIGMLYRNNIVTGGEITNEWVHVTTEDNKAGWSHRGFLELVEETPPPSEGQDKYRVDAASLNLRQGLRHQLRRGRLAEEE
ncbi:MAG: SH3 domain-containing protein [Candidatus Moduliflexus flocculans]|nr:SH3 domain-containing protein [Candidatus Moduliflexus flocculans]